MLLLRLPLFYIPTSDGIVWFKVTASGELQDTSPFNNCQASTLSSAYVLNIPELVFNNISYSVDLQYVPGSGNDILFKGDRCGCKIALSEAFISLAPNIAEPTLTIVDPSAIAISKSFDMPMDKSAIRNPQSASPLILSLNSLSLLKYGRACSGSSKMGRFVMSPLTLRLVKSPIVSIKGTSSSSETPCFVSSWESLTSMSRSSTFTIFRLPAEFPASSLRIKTGSHQTT